MSELVPEKFSSRPAIVEAVQWDGTAAGATPIIDWVLANGGTARYDDQEGGATLAIETNAGTAFASPKYWVVKGKEDFYPCDPETFAHRWASLMKLP